MKERPAPSPFKLALEMSGLPNRAPAKARVKMDLGIIRLSDPQVKMARSVIKEVYFDLTPRERDVMQLIAEGLTNQQIANKLKLEEPSVRNLSSRIHKKTHLNRVQLVYGNRPPLDD
jgi:DNA-binding CsgD family transcriptional regulator